MLMRGLLRETANLYASGGLPDESQVTRAIGYRQALTYLSRKDAKRNDHAAFVAFIDDFATATRQYAKKQMQWFRRDAEFAFIPVQMECDKAKRVADAAKIIGDMCTSCREDFDAELWTSNNESDESNELPLSARTKSDNERQGKTMKFFISKRTRLMEGSDEFLAALVDADECTKLVQCLGDEF
jgi:tRNA dimethylallyltransferase